MAIERVNLLGVGVSALNMGQAVALIDTWVAERRPRYVCVTSAHGLMACREDPQLRRIFNRSGMTTPDGMPLVWMLRYRGFRTATRVYGPDLMLASCAYGVQKGYRHFFYGGAPGVADLLAQRLAARLPGLLVAGVYSPPFRVLTPDEDEAVMRLIAEARADIVWVGISTPKQEQWMAEHAGKIAAPVLIGVGAAFDFLSGVKKQAPRWMQRSGLEWLYRLMSEPKRLWKRYAKHPLFALLILLQVLGIKRYTLE